MEKINVYKFLNIKYDCFSKYCGLNAGICSKINLLKPKPLSDCIKGHSLWKVIRTWRQVSQTKLVHFELLILLPPPSKSWFIGVGP